jgi:hypothetical protein
LPAWNLFAPPQLLPTHINLFLEALPESLKTFTPFEPFKEGPAWISSKCLTFLIASSTRLIVATYPYARGFAIRDSEPNSSWAQISKSVACGD